jgi:hypothetical protein
MVARRSGPEKMLVQKGLELSGGYGNEGKVRRIGSEV